ncbi:hypothetical protein CSW98_00105 [Vibrio sp. HA2012]|uniref:YbaY family lipoprotein n=1 Tax=Vibrio sp. HA2012 TaxID=1971595 RepID=UPI000C2C9CB9|nr:YbaY family lipoprotein [Vibrio sp. HA2012]PJC87570.1 hypothetical protein CSW98_00105 [Vibrio sp. HA2012]
MEKLLILVSSVFLVLLVGCQSEEKVIAGSTDMAGEVQVVQDTATVVTDTLVSQDATETAATDTANVIVQEDVAEQAEATIEEQVQDITEQPVIAESEVVQETEATDQAAILDVIKGNISADAQEPLPEGAIVTVTLEDVSTADVPAEVVSQQTFLAEGEMMPIDFELNFDTNKIEETHQYSVRVGVEVDGKLKLTTDKIYPVITDVNNTKQINLSLVGA